MKKYAVALDPVAVGRMREESRKIAARENRDVSWVSLLRGLMTDYLAGRQNVVVPAPTGSGR
ncbi:hypothetical protein [Urbifossiella limnaea]|uniref:Uncharacterized protein n=1 Tax=Urbifossiella limnaea TaxID=2528023 RepID=A0A517XSW1_9BACT|nr:hypothetical protein [Urbifossiella limnaea]QDU20573.1 hypothetical protein ETAA1_25280 [Urbifossiella limnaea]